MFHTFLLHEWRGKLSAVHLRSNGWDLRVTIHIYAFHQRRWSKIRKSIQWLHPILPINWDVLRWCKSFLGFSSNQTVETPQSLNLLLSFTSNLYAFKECLKVKLCRENREKLIHEHQRSSSNSWNENPLIRQEVGSIWALSWVRNRVFVLIFLPISLDFNLKLYI